MTEEIKEENVCKCCKCCEKVKEFVFKALIVYVGVTLAIITSANILKPKCPFGKMMRPPVYMGQEFDYKMAKHKNPMPPHKFKFHKHRMDVKTNMPEKQ